MKKGTVLSMMVGVTAASTLALSLFYFVTVVMADAYIAITGRLIHADEATNRALLHLVSQCSVLGSLGGTLFVMQLLTNYVARGKLSLIENHSLDYYFFYATITPLKGLIAGLVGGSVIGGAIMLALGIEGLRKAHLLVIGCACIAGYSEQFLQRVVDLASRKIEKL